WPSIGDLGSTMSGTPPSARTCSACAKASAERGVLTSDRFRGTLDSLFSCKGSWIGAVEPHRYQGGDHDLGEVTWQENHRGNDGFADAQLGQPCLHQNPEEVDQPDRAANRTHRYAPP